MVVQSRSRLTHTAKRLEARGWVTREQCADDRRGVELVLTPVGLEAVDQIAKVHVQSVRDNLVDIMTPSSSRRSATRWRSSGTTSTRRA